MECAKWECLLPQGLFALKNNIPRLKEDHEKAKVLAEELSKLQNVTVDVESVQTNIVMFTPINMSADVLLSKCKENGLILGTGKVGVIRAVTHMDVSMDEIKEAVKIVERLVS